MGLASRYVKTGAGRTETDYHAQTVVTGRFNTGGLGLAAQLAKDLQC